MVATISADIVRSTSLNTNDLIGLRNDLRGLLNNLESDYPGFWARIVRGDSIECFVPDYKYVLRIAILIKLFVKMHVAVYDCDEMLRYHGIRFSIGIADINYADKKDDIINGSAIYMSGRNLDEISRRDNIFSALEVDGVPMSISDLLESYVALISNMIDSYSSKKAEVIFYKLLGFKEKEISDRLGINQPAVNMRSTSAQWGLLNTAIKDFEKIVL